MTNQWSTTSDGELVVRKIPFEFPPDIDPCWNRAKPEWSHMVNGASLVMPFLEPYLIKAVRMGLGRITDVKLRAVASDYCAQEGQHYRQHKRFNDLLIAAGYPQLTALEERMERAYARLLERRSLKFHLAYAAGFESMALSVGHWLVDDREYLFGGSDARVASLILWHFVEEIEHKNAAIDVYNDVFGDYFYRIYGLFYASIHVMVLSRRAYRSMLVADGVWFRPLRRLRVWKLACRFFAYTVPHMLRCCARGHDPRDFDDPQWAIDWISAFRDGKSGVPILDTQHLAGPLRA